MYVYPHIRCISLISNIVYLSSPFQLFARRRRHLSVSYDALPRPAFSHPIHRLVGLIVRRQQPPLVVRLVCVYVRLTTIGGSRRLEFCAGGDPVNTVSVATTMTMTVTVTVTVTVTMTMKTNTAGRPRDVPPSVTTAVTMGVGSRIPATTIHRYHGRN